MPDLTFYLKNELEMDRMCCFFPLQRWWDLRCVEQQTWEPTVSFLFTFDYITAESTSSWVFMIAAANKQFLTAELIILFQLFRILLKAEMV